MNPIYKSRGGGWFKTFSASWPFVGFSIYEDRIEVQRPSLSGSAVESFKWNDIKYVKRILVMPFVIDGIYIAPIKPEDYTWFIFLGASPIRK